MIAIGCTSVLLACGDALPVTPARQASDVLLSLAIEPRALTMAKNETFQLVTVAQSLTGMNIDLPDTLPIRYVSENPDQVMVSASGMITARQPTPYDVWTGPDPIYVTATWTYHGVTKADTIYVAVTETAPGVPATAASLRFAAPYPHDSTWLGTFLGDVIVPVWVTTSATDTLREGIVYLQTKRRASKVADYVDPISHHFLPNLPAGERVWVHASATVYGVALRDSVQYLITDPILGRVDITASETGNIQSSQFARTIAPCAYLIFSNAWTSSVKITFDSPESTTACTPWDETGDITLPPAQQAVRRIRTSGEHSWKVTRSDGTPFVPAIRGSVQVRSHTEL